MKSGATNEVYDLSLLNNGSNPFFSFSVSNPTPSNYYYIFRPCRPLMLSLGRISRTGCISTYQLGQEQPRSISPNNVKLNHDRISLSYKGNIAATPGDQSGCGSGRNSTINIVCGTSTSFGLIEQINTCTYVFQLNVNCSTMLLLNKSYVRFFNDGSNTTGYLLVDYTPNFFNRFQTAANWTYYNGTTLKISVPLKDPSYNKVNSSQNIQLNGTNVTIPFVYGATSINIPSEVYVSYQGGYYFLMNIPSDACSRLLNGTIISSHCRIYELAGNLREGRSRSLIYNGIYTNYTVVLLDIPPFDAPGLVPSSPYPDLVLNQTIGLKVINGSDLTQSISTPNVYVTSRYTMTGRVTLNLTLNSFIVDIRRMNSSSILVNLANSDRSTLLVRDVVANLTLDVVSLDVCNINKSTIGSFYASYRQTWGNVAFADTTLRSFTLQRAMGQYVPLSLPSGIDNVTQMVDISGLGFNGTLPTLYPNVALYADNNNFTDFASLYWVTDHDRVHLENNTFLCLPWFVSSYCYCNNDTCFNSRLNSSVTDLIRYLGQNWSQLNVTRLLSQSLSDGKLDHNAICAQSTTLFGLDGSIGPFILGHCNLSTIIRVNSSAVVDVISNYAGPQYFSAIAEFASSLAKNKSEPFSFAKGNISLAVQSYDNTKNLSLSVKDSSVIVPTGLNLTDSVFLAQHFPYEQFSSLFQMNENGTDVDRPATSITGLSAVGPDGKELLVVDAKGNFTINMKLNGGIPTDKTVACIYWNETQPSWMRDNCVTSYNESLQLVSCSCNHLTNFSIAIVKPPAQSATDAESLSPPTTSGFPLRTLLLIVCIGGGSLVLIIVAIVVTVSVRRSKSRSKDRGEEFELSLERSVPTMSTDSVVTSTKIGEGKYGTVYRGLLHSTTDVAVKKLVYLQEKPSFLREADVMQRLHHPYIVQYFGMYTNVENAMNLVMEYMPEGDLQSYLRNCPQLSADVLLNMVIDVAAALAYIEMNNWSHGDVRAKNVLVKKAAREECKLYDFSKMIGRDFKPIPKSKKEVKKDIRHEAPEAEKEQTIKSDVWSFGVFVWETFSKGAQPYEGMSEEQIEDMIKRGERLKMPASMYQHATLYTTMGQCWLLEPSERPSFQAILKVLEPMAPKRIRIDSKPAIFFRKDDYETDETASPFYSRVHDSMDFGTPHGSERGSRM
ncbi:protein tyrosine kinase src [Planoprotostelium fungivorum]|uniref:Protein tyrosine kinase src n=1 Tax=Planoprotostelium fungivorum TaxID=1890364 RepID=A0A2P6NFC3_9EUKA|nr:protein tyrosine kinase src [Planoprotostelium fungivorum]